MVCRFVKKQKIGSLDKQTTQSYSASFTTGKDTNRLIRRRASQCIHRLLELRIDIPCIESINFCLKLAHLFHEGIEIGVGIGHFFRDFIETGKLGKGISRTHTHVLKNSLGIIQFGLLHEDSDGVTGAQARLAITGLIQASHNFEDRGFTGTVRSDHTDLRTRVESHGDIVKDDFVTNGFTSLNHLVDELRHGFSVQDHVT